MGDRQAERGPRVTSLELFFDLVVVFAITQVTSFLSRSPTWSGLLRGLLLLGALWWAWAAYAWLTNTLDPEEGVVRLAVLGATAAMLLVSLAAPGAFGSDAVLFGIAYFIVRSLHLVLYGIAGRDDRDLFRACCDWFRPPRLVPPCSWRQASSTIRRSWRSGARRSRSTTSVPSWAACADGACRQSTSSSASA